MASQSKSSSKYREDEERRGSQSSNIHEKLYLEKDKYFELKKLDRNTKLESEIEECTFSPSTTRHKEKNRSFNQLYNEIMSAHKKTEEKI
jgi:hypothetical protein